MTSTAVEKAFGTISLCAMCLACGGASDEGLYGPSNQTSTGGSGGGANPSGGSGGTPSGGSCEMEGLWAVFVEVGVDWESGTIKPGAGTTKQWILSQRTIENGRIKENARVCGVGARGVPLGSPWFSIVDIPELGLIDEWTGVQFLASTFDTNSLPETEIWTTVDLKGMSSVQLGAKFTTEAKPFVMGAEGLAPDAEWPDIAGLTPLMVDHDGDGLPGISGVPFQGEVPGEDGIMFADPRLDVLVDPPPRANPLFMAIRTQAALEGELVSCDPPTIEGIVQPGTLKIDSRVVGCTVTGTGEPCIDTQYQFVDNNLPEFKFNGASVMKAVRVDDGTTCPEVRAMFSE